MDNLPVEPFSIPEELKRTGLMRRFFPVVCILLLVACSAPAAFTPTHLSVAVPTDAAPVHRIKLGTVERDITYCETSGIELKMDVYYPEAMSKPAPMVVYVHGGSWSSGSKSDGMGMTDVPELLGRGYLVGSVDYRHAPEWKFPAQIEDAKCAIRFLRANASRFNLDPNRVGAWGHSAGGHLVALLGTTDPSAGFEGSGGYLDQSSRIQAAVDMCGRADLRGMPADKAASVFGATDSSSDGLLRGSPITFVSKDDAPFLILHGEEDGTVPPHVSQLLYDRLQAVGVPVKLVMVKNADHSFNPVDGAMSPTRAEMTKLIADFFDQYLRASSSPK
jgi:acetyl esterase/lipase